MLRVTKKILLLFNRRQKVEIAGLIVLMLIGGLVESLSVSLVLPLVQAVTENDEWKTGTFANIACNLFDVNSKVEYISTLLLILIAIFILKNKLGCIKSFPFDRESIFFLFKINV